MFNELADKERAIKIKIFGYIVEILLLDLQLCYNLLKVKSRFKKNHGYTDL